MSEMVQRVGKLSAGIDLFAAPDKPQPAPALVEAERKPFDYTVLSAETATLARQAVEDIRGWQKAAVIDTGRALIKVKEALGHGAFGAWLEAEFGMGHRTATNYMNAAVFAEGKTANISKLPSTALYALASPDADQMVVAEVLAEVEAGAVIPAQAVRDRLNEATKARMAAEAAAKKTPDEVRKAKEAERRRLAAKKQRDEEWRTVEEARLERSCLAALGAGNLLFAHLPPAAIADLGRLMLETDWSKVQRLFIDASHHTHFGNAISTATAESVAENFRRNTTGVQE